MIITILKTIKFIISLIRDIKSMNDNPQRVMDFMYNKYTKYTFSVTLFILGVLYCVYSFLSFASFLLNNNNPSFYTVIFKVSLLITILNFTGFLLSKMFINYNKDRITFLRKNHTLAKV